MAEHEHVSALADVVEPTGLRSLAEGDDGNKCDEQQQEIEVWTWASPFFMQAVAS